MDSVFEIGDRIEIIKCNSYQENLGLRVGMTGVIFEKYKAFGGPAARIILDERIEGGHNLNGRCERGYGVNTLLENLSHCCNIPEFEIEDVNIMSLFR